MRPLTPPIVAGWLLVAILVFGPPLELPAWLPIGAPSARWKATELDVLAMYDATPAAVVQMNHDHPGIGDILTATAPGSVRDWVKQQGGDFRLMGKDDPQPSMDKPWVQAAWNVWKSSGGSVPWIEAASPNGRGISQPPPEQPADMLTALKPLGVK